MVKLVTAILSVAAILMLFGGCGSSEKETIYVYCDEVLSSSVTQIVSKFEKTSDYTVKLIVDPEDRVFRRMKLSNHADLYLSITPHLIEEATDFGLSKGGEEVAYVKPAMITAPLNPLEIDSFNALKEADIRFGINKQNTTLCVITKLLFEKNGYDWEEACQAVYLPAESEMELFEGIRNGMADVAIVWDMTAQQEDRIEYIEMVPGESVCMPVIAMKLDKSEHPQAVDDLIAFMQSPEAQEIWEEFGLSSSKEVN